MAPLQFIDDSHKRRTLQYKGFDPDKFDVDNNTGNIIPKVAAPQPTLNPPTPESTIAPPVISAKPSTFKSAAIGAATGVLPAAGGLGAAIAAQPIIAPIALATGPAAPITELGLSIAAAMGGASGINWLQNKLMPSGVQQQVAEAQQENPLSFAGGNLVGQLPMMAANPKGVLQAGKTGLKLLNNTINPNVGRLAISGAEKANIANVGIGAAIPAGQVALESITGDEPVDPKLAALEILGGATLNKPTSLANKLFKLSPTPEIKPSVSPEQLKRLSETVGPSSTLLSELGPRLESELARREVSQGIIPPGYKTELDIQPPVIKDPLKAIEDTILSPEIRTKLSAKGNLPERYKQALPESGVLKKLGVKQDVVKPYMSAEDSATAMFGGNETTPGLRASARLETGGDQPKGETTFKTGPESLGLPKAKSLDQIATERESNYGLYKKLISEGKLNEAVKFGSDLGEGQNFGKRYTAEKASGKPEAFDAPEPGKVTAAEKQLLADRRKNFQGLLENKNNTPLTAEDRLKKVAEKAGNEPKIKATKEFFDTFNKIFGPLRNVKQSLDGRLVNRETGKPVRGEIEAVRDGMTSLMSKVNPDLATPDTVPHEFIHGWFTDFKNSPNRYEKASAINLERAIEQLPEFKSDNQRRIDNKKSPLSPEEFIAETGGYEVFNRAVNLDGNSGTFKKGWKDFVSQVKLKLNKASVEDIQNYVANRFIKDPSFGETNAAKYHAVANEEDNQNTTKENPTDTKPTTKESQVTDAKSIEQSRVIEENRQAESQGIEAGKPKEATGGDSKKEVNNQESDEGTKSDYQQYLDVQAKISEKIKKGEFEGPEFQALWKENEVIKNRNGGMPPKPAVKNQAIDDEAETPNQKAPISRPPPQATKASEIRANIDKTLALPEFRKSGIVRQNLNELKTRLPIFGSDLDKLATRGGESGKYLAPSIKEALTKMDEFEGRYYNPSVENIKSLSYDDQRLLIDTMREEHITNKDLRDTLPTEQLKKSYDLQRELLKQKQEDQIKAGQPVDEYVKGPRGGFRLTKRLPKINPYYFPDVAGSKQLDIILNHEGSGAFDILKTDFINHIRDKYKFDDATANEFFEDYKASFGGGQTGGGSSTRFGAVRRAEGVGLPDSWLESDPAVTLRRYWRRVAKDRAWFDAVEKDPNNLYVLGQQKDAWGNDVKPTKDNLARIPSNETLRGIIDTIQGVNIKTNPKIDAIARIANNLILGPLTGVNDVISALPVASKFIPSIMDAPKVYIDAIKNITTGIKNAKSTGRIKEKISNLEDIYFPTTETVERLRQMGDGVAKISGREKLEEFSRGLAQAAGESIVKIHRGLADSGNEKSIKFLETLGNKSDWKSMDDIQLASRIVDLSQGTYDVRGLPSWMINSQVAPMFRMMKWNVEQLNNLHKHVIIPATNGNLTPLLMTITAGSIGGYLAKEVREALSNKELQVPNIKEIINSTGGTGDKIHGATYAAAAAMSYSGTLGFLGEMLKTTADVSYKNKPNGFNFPAVEVVTDMVDNISDAIQAMVQDGESPLKVIPELTKRLFTNNIQVGRLALNWMGDSEAADTTRQRRDLRVYKQQSGKEYQAQTLPQNVNPYVGTEAKKFQKISDVKELIPEARKQVKNAVEESKGNAGQLKAKLQKLKAGAVTTFPSIDNAPAEFKDYYDYLVKTYGVAEAKRRVSTYQKQRAINQTRRSLIPSLD